MQENKIDNTEDLDTLISIKIDINNSIKKIKNLLPMNSGREKSIAVTKLEEANHRIAEAIELHKQIK